MLRSCFARYACGRGFEELYQAGTYRYARVLHEIYVKQICPEPAVSNVLYNTGTQEAFDRWPGSM